MFFSEVEESLNFLFIIVRISCCNSMIMHYGFILLISGSICGFDWIALETNFQTHQEVSIVVALDQVVFLYFVFLYVWLQKRFRLFDRLIFWVLALFCFMWLFKKCWRLYLFAMDEWSFLIGFSWLGFHRFVLMVTFAQLTFCWRILYFR